MSEQGKATGVLQHPVPGTPVTSRLNPNRRHPIYGDIRPHNGTDFGAPTGTPVGAADGGTVTFAGNAGGGGNTVVIDHGNGFATLYMHLQNIDVKVGQQLAPRERLGTVGSTGNSTGPHLHFELREGGNMTQPFRGNSAGARPRDPEQFIGRDYTDALVLREGDRGSPVRDLQVRLASSGFLNEEDIDGDYGPKTKAAVERLQAANGLPVDGLAGPSTRATLQESSQADRPIPPPEFARRQVEALRQPLPAPVRQILDSLQRQYATILENPDTQQMARQLQEWQQNLQRQLERIPEPIRDSFERQLPVIGKAATFLQAKQSWDALPKWVQDTAISLAPFSDAAELLRQTYNGATGKDVDPVIVTLSTLGLAGDLGWLDGFVVDPLDFLNGGAAVAKAAYKQMDGPAQEVFAALIRKTVLDPDNAAAGIAKFSQRLNDLLPHADAVLASPNALPRLLNLDDASFQRALSSRLELDAAIRRSEVIDRFVGKSLPELGTAEGNTFAQIYQMGENGILKSTTPGYPALRVRAGKLEEIVSGVGNATPSQIGRQLNRAGDAASEGKQQWDLLPDWMQKRLISVAPFGNGIKALRELYRGITDRGTNAAKTTIYALKQAATLGWLEGPDSPAGLSQGIGLLEETYAKLPDGPAKNALETAIAGAHRSASEAVTLVRRLSKLAPHAETLKQNPVVLPALLALDDRALARATRNPQAFNAAVRAANESLAPFSDRPTLSRGASGAEVATVQTLLQSSNLLSSVDGKLGPDTERAIGEFQRANNLPVDGIVGPQTWQALAEANLLRTFQLSAGDRSRDSPASPVASEAQRDTTNGSKSNLPEEQAMNGTSSGRTTDLDRDNMAKAVSPAEFLEFIENLEFDDLRSGTGTKHGIQFSYFFQEEPASNFRYVRDPSQPGKVIDMNHVFSAAMQKGWGTELGFAQEISQLLRGYHESAFREEDLRSNALGERFWTEYMQQGGTLASQMRELFSDLASEETPLRQQPLRRQAPNLAVKVAQEFFIDIGYLEAGQADGKFDAAVAAAVRKFQQDNNLPATGAIDSRTWEALMEAKDLESQPAPAPTSQPETFPTVGRGAVGPAVAELQTLLKRLGYEQVGAIDGKFGPATEAAVRALQRDLGLSADGIVGPKTWEALETAVTNQQQATLPDTPAAAVAVASTPTAEPVDLAAAEESLGGRLWVAATQGFSLAGATELDLQGPSGDRLRIVGNPSDQTIAAITAGGQPIFVLQLQDEGLSASIPDPEAAGEALASLESNIQALAVSVPQESGELEA